MKGMFLGLCTIVTSFLTTLTPVHAKAHCKPLLAKLHHIQALQRHGYSLKKGISLRKREDKARELWWRCERGQYNPKTKSKKTKRNKNKSYKSNKSKSKPSTITPKQQLFNETKSSDFSNAAIGSRIKYQGKKLQHWLAYYQQPKQCQRPKSLAIFAFCAEDKLQQQHQFEQSYQ